MAKDSSGHGSDGGREKRNSFTSEQHHEKYKALLKPRADLIRSGGSPAHAANLMARAHDHADQALHLLRAEKRGIKSVGFGAMGTGRMAKPRNT